MNRLEILAKIDDLEDKHCKGCNLVDASKATNKYCIQECEIGAELKSLGEQLLKPSEDKIQQLLDKGTDLTRSEIQFLFDKDVSKTRIAKAMGIHLNSLNRYLNNVGGFENMKQIDRVRKMLDEGKSIKEIAKKLNITEGTASNYRTRINKEKGQKKVNPSIDYKKLYEKSEMENHELKKEIESLEDVEKGLQDELKEIEGKYYDLLDKSKEIGSFETLRGNYEKLRKENSDLRMEISLLKDRLNELDQKRETERKKHESLLNYITLGKEVV